MVLSLMNISLVITVGVTPVDVSVTGLTALIRIGHPMEAILVLMIETMLLRMIDFMTRYTSISHRSLHSMEVAHVLMLTGVVVMGLGIEFFRSLGDVSANGILV